MQVTRRNPPRWWLLGPAAATLVISRAEAQHQIEAASLALLQRVGEPKAP